MDKEINTTQIVKIFYYTFGVMKKLVSYIGQLVSNSLRFFLSLRTALLFQTADNGVYVWWCPAPHSIFYAF